VPSARHGRVAVAEPVFSKSPFWSMSAAPRRGHHLAQGTVGLVIPHLCRDRGRIDRVVILDPLQLGLPLRKLHDMSVCIVQPPIVLTLLVSHALMPHNNPTAGTTVPQLTHPPPRLGATAPQKPPKSIVGSSAVISTSDQDRPSLTIKRVANTDK